MDRMLVTQALNELKTLDSRIMNAITNAKLVGAAKTISKDVEPGVSKDAFKENAEASWDSINGLIDRREKIKNAVIESNAKTMVDICGQKLSVAKVIDLKGSIVYRRQLISTLEMKYAAATATVERKNTEVERRMEDMIDKYYSRDGKVTIQPDEYDNVVTPYKVNNEYSLVDPLNVYEIIKKEKEFVDDFTNTVDQVLQISNCTTYIEI